MKWKESELRCNTGLRRTAPENYRVTQALPELLSGLFLGMKKSQARGRPPRTPVCGHPCERIVGVLFFRGSFVAAAVGTATG